MPCAESNKCKVPKSHSAAQAQAAPSPYSGASGLLGLELLLATSQIGLHKIWARFTASKRHIQIRRPLAKQGGAREGQLADEHQRRFIIIVIMMLIVVLVIINMVIIKPG